MTGNVVTYLKEYGNTSFDEKPFGEVDALIMCQLAYLRFDGLVPGISDNKPSVDLKTLADPEYVDRLFPDEKHKKDNLPLLEGVLSGQRFSAIKCNCYLNIVEKEWETQFSATAFILRPDMVFIAFRGTDESIIGWKEDLNLSYMKEIPGQAYAVKYLNSVAGMIHGNFYVGGHSKGGNLAIYSCINAAKTIQDRVLRVYSMDGPGLRSEVIRSDRYEAIRPRITKLMPQSSIIGMMLEWETNIKVIHSNRMGIMQHDPYSWVVEDADFQEESSMSGSARVIDHTINEWIEQLSEEDRQKFLEGLYQIVDSVEAEKLGDLSINFAKNMNRVLSTMKGMDEETARMMKRVIKLLAGNAMSRVKGSVKGSVKSGVDRISGWFSKEEG